MDYISLDLAKLSTDLKMGEARTAMNLSVLKEEMNQEEALQEGLVKMMELSVTPGLGENVDVRL